MCIHEEQENMLYFRNLLLLGITASVTFADYPACTSVSEQSDGSSYVTYEGVRYWSHCNFPSPRYEQRRCGRQPNDTMTYYVCNPDDVLTEGQANTIEAALIKARFLTPYQCTDPYSTRENFTIAIAVVKNMQIPDLSQNNTCINVCGELRPILDITKRNATQDEIQVALQTFSAGLAKNWNVGSCDNTVAVVYWKKEEMLGTGTQSRAAGLVTSERIDSTQKEALIYLQNGLTSQALMILINNYRYYLIGFSPALIMLSMTGGLLLLLLVFLGCQAGKGPALSVFNDTKWDAVSTWIVNILTCAFFVEYLLVAMLYLQTRAKPWHILVPAVLALCCIVALGVLPTVTNKAIDA